MKFIKKIIFYIGNLLRESFLRTFFLKILINLHNFSYFSIKFFVINSKIPHPKHKIINYIKFFQDNVEKKDLVLDVGCFEGKVSNELAKKVKFVCGIDILEDRIDVAKKTNKLNNLKFICGDATKFNFKKLNLGKFDKIILSNVLEHIEHRIKFLTNLKKVSDIILLRVPLITRDWLSVYKKEMGYEYRLDNTHYIEYTLKQLKTELDKSGWKIKSYHTEFGEFYGVIVKK